jgi:hypothetical protein
LEKIRYRVKACKKGRKEEERKQIEKEESKFTLPKYYPMPKSKKKTFLNETRTLQFPSSSSCKIKDVEKLFKFSK